MSLRPSLRPYLLAVAAILLFYGLNLFVTAVDQVSWSGLLFVLCGLLVSVIARAGNSGQRTPAERSRLKLEWNVEAWSWLLILTVAAISLSNNGHPDSLFTCLIIGALSLSNILTGWVLPGLLGREHRLFFHFIALTLSVGFLMVLRGPLKLGFLATFLVIFIAANRYLGARAGLWIRALGLSMVLLRHLLPVVADPHMALMELLQAASEIIILLLGCRVAGQEISGRRLAEASAQASAERLAAVFRMSPAAIIVANAKSGAFTDVNDSFLRLYGYRAADLLGRTPAEINLFEEPETVTLLHQLEAGAGSLRQYECRSRTGCGRVVDILLSAELLHLGQEAYIVLVLEDVTERKQVAAQLRSMNTQLEQRVAERTAELQAAYREMEAFTYSVSHDLRAPLRSIDGFSRALIEKYSARLEPAAQEYLGRVRAASQRMAQLIDDLLQLSRVTRLQMGPSPVDLSTIARAVTAELEMTYPERTVTVQIEEGLTAQGDSHLLTLVLRNLLDNAFKFTARAESPRVEVGSAAGEDGPVFYVRDNGVGFDMACAPKLFAPFQRLHSERDFPGTGIGLALVQRIINRHGGRVWVEAAEGRGTTFFFTLRH